MTAPSHALFSAYDTALDDLIRGFRKGIVETGGSDEELVRSLYDRMWAHKNQESALTREKLLALLLICAARQARREHDEQNAIGEWT